MPLIPAAQAIQSEPRAAPAADLAGPGRARGRQAGWVLMSKQGRETELTVFLGGESQILGDLIFTGQARLDGRFQGNIRGDGTLFIGPNAHIEATVEAATVIISGELVGDVSATKRLELKAPGRLKGNIAAPLVVMDEGVVFEGHCSMTADPDPDASRGRITLLSAKG